MSKRTERPDQSSEPSPWKAVDLRREQHDAKRLLILSQAARMFVDQGFHQTTIDQIASALHVSKPTIYYYIESKEDILHQITRLALDDLDASLAIQCNATMTAIDRLENFFHTYCQIILTDFGSCMAFVTDRSLNAAHRKRLRLLKKEFELRVRAIIADGQSDGTIVVENPRFFANALFGAYNWMPQWFSHAGPATAEEAGRDIFKLFRRAVSGA